MCISTKKALYKSKKIVYNNLYKWNTGVNEYNVRILYHNFLINSTVPERTVRFLISKSKSIAVIVILLAVLVVLALLYRGKKAEEQFEQRTTMAMDTVFMVKVAGDKPDEYIELVNKLDAALDVYDEDSEIYKLNAQQNANASDVLLDAVKSSLQAEEKLSSVSITAGGLIKLWDVNGDNPTVPDEDDIQKELSFVGKDKITLSGNSITLMEGTKLNLGCCAKGYACDIIEKKLSENNVSCAIVTFGSSTLLYGKKPDGEDFVTAVRNPFEPSETLLTVKTDECFISTSGGYERFFEQNGKTYSHIFDLETGYPADTDIMSVTVICDSGIMSDMLSTELYIGGTEMVKEYLASDEYMIIAIDKNKNIYASDKLSESITLKDESFTLK